MLCKANRSPLTPDRTGQTRKGDIRYCWADTRKAEQMFGFKAEVALPDGISAFAEMA